MQSDAGGAGMLTAAPVLDMVHHLGYVVNDLAAAARRWHDIAGVGPFLVTEHMPLDELTIDGAPARIDHTAAFAAYGSLFIELQLIHDIAPPAALRYFQTAGPVGVNPVAYVVDDAAAESLRLSRRGLPCVVRARRGRSATAYLRPARRQTPRSALPLRKRRRAWRGHVRPR